MLGYLLREYVVYIYLTTYPHYVSQVEKCRVQLFRVNNNLSCSVMQGRKNYIDCFLSACFVPTIITYSRQ
jgi:hypothetical protein